MNRQVAMQDHLLRILTTPDHGVVGLVDELLPMVNEQDLQLTWGEGQCRVIFPADPATKPLQVVMHKSVFRAALARIAAICNEQTPDAVSPYGGDGQFQLPGDPPSIIAFSFTNTPAVQELKLACRQVGRDNSRDRVAAAGPA